MLALRRRENALGKRGGGRVLGQCWRQGLRCRQQGEGGAREEVEEVLHWGTLEEMAWKEGQSLMMVCLIKEKHIALE